jgi:hypothetical protein
VEHPLKPVWKMLESESAADRNRAGSAPAMPNANPSLIRLYGRVVGSEQHLRRAVEMFLTPF